MNLTGNIIVKRTIPETDDYAEYVAYINAEILLAQNGEHMHAARVIGFSQDDKGMKWALSFPNRFLTYKSIKLCSLMEL